MTWLMTWILAFSQGISSPLCQMLVVVCRAIRQSPSRERKLYVLEGTGWNVCDGKCLRSRLNFAILSLFLRFASLLADLPFIRGQQTRQIVRICVELHIQIHQRRRLWQNPLACKPLLRRHSIAESCHRPNQNIRHLIRANRLERLNGLYRILSGGVVEKLVKSATVHLVFQPANQRVHAFLLHYRTSTFWNPNPYSIAVTVDRTYLLAASRMPSSSAAFCNSACARALVSLSRSLSACTKRPVDRTYTRVCWLSIVVTNTCDGGSTRRTVRTAPFSMICTSSGFIWLMSTPAMVCPRTIINSRSPASRSGSTAL